MFMENRNPVESEYPVLLKILLIVGVLFLGSLGLLLLSIILGVLGFVYGSSNILAWSVSLEQIGILSLGLSIVLGGVISTAGLAWRSKSPSQFQLEKEKNENQTYDIRDHGLTVEDVLGDMSVTERELLAQKLAESRLAIREDGTLIPLEQAKKMSKIERFIDG